MMRTTWWALSLLALTGCAVGVTDPINMGSTDIGTRRDAASTNDVAIDQFTPTDTVPSMDATLGQDTPVASSDATDIPVAVDTTPSCFTGQTYCGTACADTSTDNNNCGMCGHACPSAQTCLLSACVCPFMQVLCDSACTNTTTDAMNCGGCGRVCATPTVCVSSMCVCSTSGQVACGSVCTSTLTDVANCGACGHACATGMACAAGVCVMHAQALSCPVATELGCGAVTLPGGSFTLGGDTLAYSDSPAAGLITVSGFTIDAYEVTVARFRRFWAAGHPSPTTDVIMYPGGSAGWAGSVTQPNQAPSANATWSTGPGSLESHPITWVDWFTAQAFCVWDGARLPTEAEWEYAARGAIVGGLTAGRAHPWGVADPSTTCDRAEWNNCTGDDGTATKQVGAFAPTAGMYDLAGNAREWVADWYASYSDVTCWNGVARTNPICNNTTMGAQVVRGGAWSTTDPGYLRGASRQQSTAPTRDASTGFRCARTP